MEIKRTTQTGTMESSDIFITLQAGKQGIEIDLNSTVEKQFGRRIKEVIETTLLEAGIQNAYVVAVDKGALDCTIKARVKAAIFQANQEEL